MSAAREPPASSSSAAQTRLERLVAQFEDAWRCGLRPDLASLLPDGVDRREALVELAHTELEFRLKAGEPARVEDYLKRFPELTRDAQAIAQLIGAEYDLRRRSEPGLRFEEYLRRFPEYGPALGPLLARQAAAPVHPPSTVRDPAKQAESVGPTPAPPTPASELRLAGYDLLGELGRGGMGVVYRAFDRKRQATVALKTLPQLDPTALYRFKQEFRALAGVSHPNLVTLYELVADGPAWFFTMEYVDGVDFLSHVREGKTRDGQRLRGALRQLAEGLSALHAAGRLHRDVKPSNVLVDRAARVVLLDFGLAAELDVAGQHQSTERHLLGTAAYMAPEQAAALPVSPASDWYSVGVMLYEALAGRLPFVGGFYQVLHDKQQLDPPPPRPADAANDLDALCMEMLRRDPAARPSGRDVLLRLGAAAAPLSLAPVGSRPLFVGREAHLQALNEAFLAMRQGRTVALWMHGPSGAGKSALARRFLDDLVERGEAVVLTGRCYEQESVPYKALDSLIDALSRYLGRLPDLEVQALLPRDLPPLTRVFPVLRRVEAVARGAVKRGDNLDPQEMRKRAFAALRELLGRLGDRQPLVLALDDLQWGDADSAALLFELLRPPNPPALLLLGCYRSEDAATSPFLRTLAEDRNQVHSVVGQRELAVDALSSADARELTLQLLGRDDHALTEVVIRESGGNPFFVYELVQRLQAGAWRADQPGPANELTLEQVLWDRVLRLPQDARRLLEAAAVAGQPLRRATACRAAGLESDEWTALALLRSGRLIRGTGATGLDEIETYHDRVRETVTSRLSPAALREYHSSLARSLEEEGQADPEFLAVHFRGAGDLGRAGDYYAQAATRAAEALAFDRAARLYRLALELQPGEASGRWSLQVRLGDALANAGRGADAAREYLAAVPTADVTERPELQRRAAEQFLRSGYIDEGIAVLRTVLSGFGLRLPATPRRALISLLLRRALIWFRGVRFRERAANQVPAEELARIDVCWSASLGLSAVDAIRGADFQARHLLLALRAGEPYRAARALALEAAHTATIGVAVEKRVERIFRDAQTLAERVGNPHASGLLTLMRGVSSYLMGRWNNAFQLCKQAEGTFRDQCIGTAWEQDTATAFRYHSQCYLGEFAAISQHLPMSLKEAQERGDLYGQANLGTFVRPILRLAEDNPDGAQEELHEIMGRWSQHGFHVQHANAMYRQTEIELYRGHGAAAWQVAVKLWTEHANALLIRIQHMRVSEFELLARSALAAAVYAADPAAFLDAALRCARRLEREKSLFAPLLAKGIRAGAAACRGDTASAVRLLSQAAPGFESLDMHLHAAAMRRRLGRLLGGDEGRVLVEQADAWMAAQTIRNPARMTAVFAPGFRDAHPD